MKNDVFGDRMKAYEKAYTSAHVPIDKILCVRIDGKGFSKFTKGFKKPFDDRICDSMAYTMKKLVENTHASIGYVQSDEITLIYTPKEKAAEYIFGGKVSKINSILASMATWHFNYALGAYVEHDTPAFFDCRAWAVPDLIEASNVLLWRVQDARKNSISSLFRWTVGHSKMHGLSGEEMKALLKSDYFTDWDLLPNKYKYGTYAKPVTVESYLSQEELLRIPAHKRPAAEVLVKRTSVQELDLGYFGDYDIQHRLEYVI
jgi:tRNA(His) 5'-end guanylyltransferase